MYSPKHNYKLFIIIILSSTILFAQQYNWSQFKNQKSPYQAYLEVQNDENRKTEVVKQKWNEGASTWENDSKEEYQYSFFNTILGIYSLQYFYAYGYVTGNWVPLHYYIYNYNALGQLSGYDYYGWVAGAWVLWGTGVFSDHNANGDWGKEIYTNVDPNSGMESFMTERYFDDEGYVTDIYYSILDGADYVNSNWKQYYYAMNYLETIISYNWTPPIYWNEYSWEKFYYQNGFNPQVGQSQGYLYDGSPTGWSRDIWDGINWNTDEIRAFEQDGDGKTLKESRLSDVSALNLPPGYNPNDPSTWNYNFYYVGEYGYAQYGGSVTINARVKEITYKAPGTGKILGTSDGTWVNTERILFSYEGSTVSTETDNSIPNIFSLEQNYPNPFNPMTNIDFMLDVNSDVVISIYDITGKMVKELVDQNYPAGVHSIKWNGTDLNGDMVSSGIYIYTLESNNTIISKKMIMMN